MEIEDNLLALTNAMLRTKAHWHWVSDEQKIKWFFIINRMFSKKFPQQAQLLNLKSIDKVSAMNLWWGFMYDKPYPSWLWTKTEKIQKSDLAQGDYILLLRRLGVKDLDLDYLIEHQPDFIKEELKYFKNLEKKTN